MVSYSIFGTEKWETYFTYQVSQYLKDVGRDVNVYSKMRFKLDITESSENWYGDIRKYIICQNESTGQFFVIDHSDQYDYVSEAIVSHPLCVGVLKCQYRQGNYGEWEHKVSSFSYGVKERDAYLNHFMEMRKLPKKNNVMYFKGNETGRGNILKKLAEMGLINPNYGFRDGKGNRNQKIPQKDYLKNMAECKLILSLPGVGNFCHREIESFGIGVPVLMPTLQNQYYNDLVPNKHYVALDVSDIGDHRIKEYNQKEEDKFCSIVKNRYDEVVNDRDFLDRIVINAIDWFNENIMFPSNIELMQKILLEKFKYVF